MGSEWRERRRREDGVPRCRSCRPCHLALRACEQSERPSSERQAGRGTQASPTCARKLSVGHKATEPVSGRADERSHAMHRFQAPPGQRRLLRSAHTPTAVELEARGRGVQAGLSGKYARERGGLRTLYGVIDAWQRGDLDCGPIARLRLARRRRGAREEATHRPSPLLARPSRGRGGLR